MAKHSCHVDGCEKQINPKYLMCAQHWALVPRKLQIEVYKYYREGQCDDKKPSPEWMIAARRAMNAVTGKADSSDTILAALLRRWAKKAEDAAAASGVGG